MRFIKKKVSIILKINFLLRYHHINMKRMSFVKNEIFFFRENNRECG